MLDLAVIIQDHQNNLIEVRGSRKAAFFMRYRKLDSNDDFSFGSSLKQFHVNTPEAVGQAILTRLRLWIGEWFADRKDGTGWNQSILGKQTKNLYEMTLRQRVLQTFGVLSIENFESLMDATTRRLTVSMTVNTIYGEAYLNEDLTA